jgi:AcrR family transcriptional regulator
MARPHMISDEEILARARTVFLERGFGARTTLLSAAVGLTWGAIAMRFESKRGLFVRAMAAPPDALDKLAADLAEVGDLTGLLELVRAHLWEQWPRQAQYRLARPHVGPEEGACELVPRLDAALARLARSGRLRTDLAFDDLARILLAVLTGDVARRFLAREPRLEADPALVDSLIRLVCTTPSPRAADAVGAPTHECVTQS